MGLPSPYEPGLKFQPYKEARVTVTSEENAYGQTSKRWFDGVAKSSLIKSEGLVSVNDMSITTFMVHVHMNHSMNA